MGCPVVVAAQMADVVNIRWYTPNKWSNRCGLGLYIVRSRTAHTASSLDITLGSAAWYVRSKWQDLQRDEAKEIQVTVELRFNSLYVHEIRGCRTTQPG